MKTIKKQVQKKIVSSHSEETQRFFSSSYRRKIQQTLLANKEKLSKIYLRNKED